MLVVRGAMKNYDWGIVDGLAAWTPATGEPQAELWFGVHPGGPTPVIDSTGAATGAHLADHFDVEHIPILVKLLAAARPLSVQVHPNSAIAAAMWRSQQVGVSSSVLSDPFEKTEMLVALGPFAAFAGWRDRRQAGAILDGVPGCGTAAAALAAGGVKHAIVSLLESDGVPAKVAALPGAAAAAGLTDAELHAYGTVAAMFSNDAGALVTPLLDFVSLAKGEAVFLPAGVPHSYIHGTGIEVMTSSDNVLRLGLTSKDVYVDQALTAIDLALTPTVLRTRVGQAVAPAGAAFAVTLHESGETVAATGCYRIVLAIEGTTRVATIAAETDLRPGTAAVLSAADVDARVTVQGMCAVVTSSRAKHEH